MKKFLLVAVAVIALMGIAHAETPFEHCVTNGVVNVTTLPMATDKIGISCRTLAVKRCRLLLEFGSSYPTGPPLIFMLAMLIRTVSNGIGLQGQQDQTMITL